MNAEPRRLWIDQVTQKISVLKSIPLKQSKYPVPGSSILNQLNLGEPGSRNMFNSDALL